MSSKVFATDFVDTFLMLTFATKNLIYNKFLGVLDIETRANQTRLTRVVHTIKSFSLFLTQQLHCSEISGQLISHLIILKLIIQFKEKIATIQKQKKSTKCSTYCPVHTYPICQVFFERVTVLCHRRWNQKLMSLGLNSSAILTFERLFVKKGILVAI